MTLALDRHRHLHFIGIGGAGMSALARYALARGFTVSGSDRDLQPATDKLGHLGATVHSGHDGTWQGDADLVVVSSAVPDDNVEVVAAHRRGIPVVKRAELLAAVMNPAYGIAVAGTHGKSTTSALIGHILTVTGRDPTVLIGAVSQTLASNARVGASRTVVVEADEYDASFLHLRPHVGVVLNVEAEHLDFYGTEAEVLRAFGQFAAAVSDGLIVCADDPGARQTATHGHAPVVTYGLDRGDWRAHDLRPNPDGTAFEAVYGSSRIQAHLPLPGVHNVRNALAAIATATLLGIASADIADGLRSFRGVRRRLETRGEVDGVLIVDDYAHHPTEIRASLAAVRQRHPDRRLLLVFQPHTYSRTRAFFGDLALAVQGADRTYLMDIYAARERETCGVHSRDLAAAAERHGAWVHYTGTLDSTMSAVHRDLRPDDLLVTMGAGDVYRVADRLLEPEQAIT